MTDASRLRQHVRYVTASDGTRLAWAEAGTGPLLVKAANWLTHLEYEWQSPVWKHWLQFFSANCRFVRYDERGCGMSAWHAGALSLDQWADDLGTIIDAAQPEGPVTLLGISQGAATCIHYALRHPERVARLIFYGGYSHGALKRGTPDGDVKYQAMIELARVAWGADNPTFRQVFTSRFFPGGTHEQLEWFNELCLKTTTGDIAARLFEARAQIDIAAVARRRARADAGAARARRRGGARRGRAAARERHSGRRVRRARLAQSHPAGARTGVAAVPGGRAVVPETAGAAGAAIRRSRRCPRESARS